MRNSVYGRLCIFKLKLISRYNFSSMLTYDLLWTLSQKDAAPRSYQDT